MELLFNSPITSIIFILSVMAFVFLPKRIEAIYYKENILSKKRLVSTTIEYGMVIIVLVSVILYIIKFGLSEWYTFLFIFFIGFIMILYIYSKLKFRNQTKITVARRIYFGRMGISKEIDQVNETYPQVTISKSAGESPMHLMVQSSDKDQVEKIIDQIKKESILFMDLESPSMQNRLKLYSIIFILSVIYMIILMVYQISV